MSLQFTSASQENVNNGVKIIVYAESGTGKTVLSATLPNVVLISAEAGTLSLSRANLERIYGPDNPSINYDIPIIKISTFADLQDVNRWCYSSADAQQFQTIAIDSITEVAETVLANEKKTNKDARMAYGELSSKMEEIIKSFRDLPGKHVYMAAKSERFKDEFSGVTVFGPSMPGQKLSPKVPYLTDEVFQLAIGKTPEGIPFRYLRTQPDIQYSAKDRSGLLAQFEPPHLGDIIRKIQGGF